MHGPEQQIFKTSELSPDKRAFHCPYSKEVGQKHRINLHLNHAKCPGRPNRKMPTYLNLDIKNQPQFIQTMVDSTKVEDVIAAFQRIVPLDRSVRKPRGGAKRAAGTGARDTRSRKQGASSSRASRSMPVEADDEESSLDDKDQYEACEDYDRS